MVKVTSILSIILASIALVQCVPAGANDGNMMKQKIDVGEFGDPDVDVDFGENNHNVIGDVDFGENNHNDISDVDVGDVDFGENNHNDISDVDFGEIHHNVVISDVDVGKIDHNVISDVDVGKFDHNVISDVSSPLEQD
ncbi:unnamed protein product [Cunninghamella blakesleeana]